MTRRASGVHTASCGALHLVWENATVQLRPHDLSTLRCALELGHVAPFRVLVEDDTGDTVQIWRYSR